MKTGILTTITGIACLLLLENCGSKKSGSRQQSANTDFTVINHLVGQPASLHPYNDNTQIGMWVSGLMHSYLLITDVANQDIAPDLAVALPEESEDGLSYTFTLRDGITWDDGSPFTVEDVIFSYKAASCVLTQNASRRVYLQYLDEVVAHPSDKNKVVMKMKEKYILNKYLPVNYPVLQRAFYDKNNVLSKYSFAQLTDLQMLTNAPADLQEWATAFNDPANGVEPDKIKGLGPYKLEKWEKDQSIILVRKEKFWQQGLENPGPQHTAYPSRLIFKVVTDDEAIALELKKRELDASVYVSTKSLIELQKDEEFNKHFYSDFIDMYSFNYLIMNTKPAQYKRKRFFDDVNVRRAIAMLVPTDKLIQDVYDGKARRMNGPVTPIKKEADNTLPQIDVDVERAKNLLEAAGWKDTDGDNIRDKVIDGKKVKFEFELMFAKGPAVIDDIVKTIAESMYLAGIKLKPVDVEQKVYIQNARNHDFDMLMGAFSDSFEPVDFTQLWHTSSINGGDNYACFGDAASDALIDSIKVEMNEEKRVVMSHRLQKMIYDAHPWVFMLSAKRKVVLSKKYGNANMYVERPWVLLNNLTLKE